MDAYEIVLAAAHTAFARDGYQTSPYGTARDVGVDLALVHHYPPNHATLLVKAAIESTAGVDADLIHRVAFTTELEPEHLGEGTVRVFIGLWDGVRVDHFTVAIHATFGQGSDAEPSRGFTTTGAPSSIVTHFCPDHPQLCAQLIASQIIGLSLARWVARMGHIAGLDVKALAALIDFTIQRYVFDDLPGLVDPARVNPNPSLDRGSSSIYIHHTMRSDVGDTPRELGVSSQSHDLNRDATAFASLEQPAVIVMDLRVTRGCKEILHGPGLDLAPGTIIGLLSPPSYGKTTLMRIAVGV